MNTGRVGEGDPVVVVGSGPAGAMAAHVLAGRGAQVVVLEAGAKFPGGLFVRAFGRTVVKVRGEQAPPLSFTSSGGEARWFAEYSPGGLSNRWTGAVPRYSPQDFLDGARLHEKYAWPIRYSDLEPFYALSEQLLRVSGTRTGHPAVPAGTVRYEADLPRDWRRLAAGAAARGETIMAAPLAAGAPWGIYRRETPFNSYASILRPLLKDREIEVRLGAHVLRIDADSPRPTVVYYDALKQEEAEIPARAVVLACGAINTARVLLQSTSARHPAGLGNDAGLVGAYLHDHPHHMYTVKLARPLSRLRHIAHLTRAPYEGSAPLSAAQTTLGARATQLERVLSAFPTKSDRLGAVVFGTMIPRRENRVTLSESAKEQPHDRAVDIDIRFTTEDIATTGQAEDRMLGILDDAGFGPQIMWRSSRLAPGSSVHYAGTARMHTSPEFGVTDSFNRLHDYPSVLAVDSSCFTTCVEKNPALTAMAISARAADQLADDLAGRC